MMVNQGCCSRTANAMSGTSSLAPRPLCCTRGSASTNFRFECATPGDAVCRLRRPRTQPCCSARHPPVQQRQHGQGQVRMHRHSNMAMGHSYMHGTVISLPIGKAAKHRVRQGAATKARCPAGGAAAARATYTTFLRSSLIMCKFMQCN
eukprot:360726-Chlamydomonas_euryale.AAC.1